MTRTGIALIPTTTQMRQVIDLQRSARHYADLRPVLGLTEYQPHVTLMQGGKAYGVHLGPLKRVPLKESDGRTMPPNFYYDQEDLVRERQAGKRWTWTALRPPSQPTSQRPRNVSPPARMVTSSPN